MNRRLSQLAIDKIKALKSEDGLSIEQVDRRAVYQMSIFMPEDNSDQRRAFQLGTRSGYEKPISNVKLPVRFVDVELGGDYL
jgi:hypothetical protein